MQFRQRVEVFGRLQPRDLGRLTSDIVPSTHAPGSRVILVRPEKVCLPFRALLDIDKLGLVYCIVASV